MIPVHSVMVNIDYCLNESIILKVNIIIIIVKQTSIKIIKQTVENAINSMSNWKMVEESKTQKKTKNKHLNLKKHAYLIILVPKIYTNIGIIKFYICFFLIDVLQISLKKTYSN